MALKLSGQYKKNQDLVLQKKEDLHHKKRQPNSEDNDNKMTTCHKPNYKTL